MNIGIMKKETSESALAKQGGRTRRGAKKGKRHAFALRFRLQEIAPRPIR